MELAPLFVLIFLIEVVTLYILSRLVLRGIVRIIVVITKRRRVGLYILSLILLPGTLIHEFSHWIFATILLVKTGKMSLWPKIEPQGIRLGSLEIAQTDIIRRTIVGFAPFLLGTALILILVHIAIQSGQDYLLLIFVGYAVFQIGNTMFSSKKDLEGTGIFLVLLFAILIAAYLLGFQVPQNIVSWVQPLTVTTDTLLLVPLAIDLGLVLLLKVL
jgi:hypothetical protein